MTAPDPITAPTSTRALELIARWAATRDLPLRSDPATGAGAVFSRCTRYRYLLWRRPIAGQPFMGFAMLNPSTADHQQDDPTIRRCTAWAAKARLAGPLVWNLFALRATRPATLKASRLPIGIHNDAALDLALQLAGVTVAAWGNHGAHLDRAAQVLHRCAAARAKLHIIGLTQRGQPGHPLYQPAALNPQPWEYAA